MKYDSDPLDPNSFDEEQNVEATDEESLAAYMTSEMARAVFEAELEAMARGVFPGPTPRIGAWTEAHELMAEVESPSYMPTDTARGELFEEDEELGYLMREQGRYFAGDGYPLQRQACNIAQARHVASNREVIRRIRRPRAFSDIQKRPRRAVCFPPASRRMNPEDR